MKADEISRLYEIIEVNGLSRQDKEYIPGTENSTLLLGFLSKLDLESRELAFLLIEKYDIITEYRQHALSIMSRLAENYNQTVCLFPILPFRERQIKSGSSMIYELRSLLHLFEGRFTIYDTPNSSELLNSPLPKFAVDDFIGTGDQFFEMMSDMRRNHGTPVDGIASIVMMETAKENIELDGYTAMAEIIKRKAISGYLHDEGHDDIRLMRIYDRVEAVLKVDHTCRRGYGNSEALVSMKRTPDNTLPIFWHKGSDGTWPAPFTR